VSNVSNLAQVITRLNEVDATVRLHLAISILHGVATVPTDRPDVAIARMIRARVIVADVSAALLRAIVDLDSASPEPPPYNGPT